MNPIEMKKLKLKKAIFLFLSITLLCNTLNKTKHLKKPPQLYKSSESFSYYAMYSNGIVYICTEKYQEDITSKLQKNDIIVLDERDNKDPNMKIIHSYSIQNFITMGEIINILLAYEEINPSLWDRTSSSMQKEWICHNISYICGYEKSRTVDVDLNNQDEEVYNNITLRKMLEYHQEDIDQ